LTQGNCSVALTRRVQEEGAINLTEYQAGVYIRAKKKKAAMAVVEVTAGTKKKATGTLIKVRANTIGTATNVKEKVGGISTIEKASGTKRKAKEIS
jgi:hypothetical protein